MKLLSGVIIIVFQLFSFCSQMSDFWINMKYESTIYSSVRETVAANRYVEKMSEHGLIVEGNNSQFAKGSFVMITDGDKTFVGGEGKLFEEFLRFRQLTGYVGEGQAIARINHTNYTTAQLAMVRFDQSFKGLPYDARWRKYLFSLLCMYIVM